MYRIKVFGQLLIAFLVIFVFVGIVTPLYVETNYEEIKTYCTDVTSPKVDIEKAEVTRLNGRTMGRITNNTGSIIDKIYIKLDFYSKYDNYLGSEYVKIADLAVNEVREFKCKYSYEEVKYEKVSTTTQEENIPKFDWNSIDYKKLGKDVFKTAIGVGGILVALSLLKKVFFLALI